MLHANLMAPCLEPQLWPLEVLQCGSKDFWPLMLLWPWPDDLHIWTWPLFLIDTGLPDVQKWTSYEYVKAFESYPIACECMHLVRRDHFRLRDKDGGHIIRSDVSENPIGPPYANLTALCFTDQSYGRSKFYIAGIWISTFLLLWPWPWTDGHTNMTRIRWRYIHIPDVQIWTSNIEAFESYRLTDRQAQPNYTASQTRCSAIAERPRCRVRYSFRQK